MLFSMVVFCADLCRSCADLCRSCAGLVMGMGAEVFIYGAGYVWFYLGCLLAAGMGGRILLSLRRSMRMMMYD